MANSRQRGPILELEVLDQYRKEHRVREERQVQEVLARRNLLECAAATDWFPLGKEPPPLVSELIAQRRFASLSCLR